MNKNTNVTEIIRRAGFRATKPRIAVLSYLRETKYPASIKEIVQAVGRKSIDQVTAYRILEAFKKVGIVTQVDFQQGRAFFELKDEHDHHHIVCTSCDKVEDFIGCEYEKLVNKALKQTSGFSKVTNHSLELFGLCNTCAKA